MRAQRGGCGPVVRSMQPRFTLFRPERWQPRVRQRARQNAAQSRILEAHRLASVDDETGALIKPERLRVVKAAGMNPEPFDRPQPSLVDRRLQQKRPEAAADEFRNQAEIAQLGLARRR